MTVGTHPDTPRAADEIDQLAVNTIRTLSIDAVQAANSGHPGTPMALAPVTYKLWQDHLRFDPELPVWANRIGSCCRWDTPRRCCTRCCTWPGSSRSTPITRSSASPPSRWRTCADSGSWTPNAPGTPSTAGPPASSAPPARWAPAPPASAWPSPDCGRQPPSTGPATSCSTTTCTRCAATAASWRASAPKPPHWRGI